jgi:hypothetical protein
MLAMALGTLRLIGPVVKKVFSVGSRSHVQLKKPWMLLLLRMLASRCSERSFLRNGGKCCHSINKKFKKRGQRWPLLVKRATTHQRDLQKKKERRLKANKSLQKDQD